MCISFKDIVSVYFRRPHFPSTEQGDHEFKTPKACFIFLYRDSSVGIVTRLCARRPTSRSFDSRNSNIFSLHWDQTCSGSHPASYSIGTMGLMPGVKRPEREHDNWILSGVEVKNAYLNSPICFHGMVLNWTQQKIHVWPSSLLFSSCTAYFKSRSAVKSCKKCTFITLEC